ncbi:hypothetical protein L917_18191 [Phytophthora nicotianae]|uniref:Uncharacterized protein n=1 Tax=Phytophthora nicotianae TaxID=4792 RepID=W2KAA2_PHYNI|nr:hypothetical protein L917_18191 [Phytophthora nicotianae]
MTCNYTNLIVAAQRMDVPTTTAKRGERHIWVTISGSATLQTICSEVRFSAVREMQQYKDQQQW